MEKVKYKLDWRRLTILFWFVFLISNKATLSISYDTFIVCITMCFFWNNMLPNNNKT